MHKLGMYVVRVIIHIMKGNDSSLYEEIHCRGS